MDLFFDTSAIVKLYHLEKGTEAIVSAVEKSTNIFISQITPIEYQSAFYKKLRLKEISEDDLTKALKLFENDLGNFQIIPITNHLIDLAKTLLSRYGKKGLRTWDSIQLASAAIEKSSFEYALCSDEKLNEFLLSENIKINPT